jgi:hypothetical protein
MDPYDVLLQVKLVDWTRVSLQLSLHIQIPFVPSSKITMQGYLHGLPHDSFLQFLRIKHVAWHDHRMLFMADCGEIHLSQFGSDATLDDVLSLHFPHWKTVDKTAWVDPTPAEVLNNQVKPGNYSGDGLTNGGKEHGQAGSKEVRQEGGNEASEGNQATGEAPATKAEGKTDAGEEAHAG